jgi:hypothetical protein
MTDHQEVNVGRNAADVLENQAYQEAMQQLRDEVIREWKLCPIRDREGALLLLQLAKLADKFEGILKGLIERGKLAQHAIELSELRDESKLKKVARKYF